MRTCVSLYGAFVSCWRCQQAEDLVQDHAGASVYSLLYTVHPVIHWFVFWITGSMSRGVLPTYEHYHRGVSWRGSTWYRKHSVRSITH